jgi:hypothetical protein
MTEKEWLVCREPEAMLDVVRFGSSDRKLRLFALACVSVIADRLNRDESKAAVDVIEQYAEGKASRTDLQEAWVGALTALRDIRDDASEQRWHYVSEYAADAVTLAANHQIADTVMGVASLCTNTLATAADLEEQVGVICCEHDRQEQLIRDIFGNPFRPGALDPAWLTSTVVALAKGIYEERAFDRMPILADALQDTGCDNDDVLDHCRGPGPHVRGCWVVDLVLGKE